MEDLQLYIYLALAAIYFLSRAFKSKKSNRSPGKLPDSDQHNDRPEDQSQRERPISFEDLLREFSGQKEKKELEKYEEAEVDEMIDYEEEIVPEEIKQPSYAAYNDPVYGNYDEVSQGKDKYKTLEEEIEIEKLANDRFNEYKIDKNESANYASRIRKFLHDKDSIKDAIILKEVLDRKYF